MMEPLVSIIIPVFNTEKYLKRCIESCVNQTLLNIEIILIDDKSTDASKKIIESFQEKYPKKIKVIYQKFNMKQGVARNCGIELATGEYLMFVDSDDWISTNACEKLYSEGKKKMADMVCGDMWRVNGEKEKKYINTYNNRYDFLGILNKNKKEQLLKSPELFSNRIYKRKLIIDNNIRFAEGIMVYEDSVFDVISLLCAKNIYKIESAFYYYFQRESSSIHQEELNYDNKFRAAEGIYNSALEISFFETYKDIVLYKITNFYVDALCGALLNSSNDYDKKILLQLQKRGRLLRKGKYYKLLNKNMKLLLLLNSIYPKFAVFFYKRILLKGNFRLGKSSLE